MKGRPSDTQPILVTGAHRSGTTWVGRMLAVAPGVQYIHEPFNPVAPPGVSSAGFDHYYVYVDHHNEARYYPHIARTLAFRYSWLAQARRIRGLRGARRALRTGVQFGRARWGHARPLMKDPLALLASEWLAERFRMDVVLMIRHPAAFVSSAKRLEWRHSFAEFLADERLMSDHLGRFEAELERQAHGSGDTIGEAILAWRVLYSVVATFRERHPDWIFVRHEDLSRQPMSMFKTLYERLGLDWTSNAQQVIEEHTRSTNPSEIVSAYSIHVDSVRNIWNWQKRLTPDEIMRIRRGVEDVSNAFYTDEDWEGPHERSRNLRRA
jgi:hypothetical protein